LLNTKFLKAVVYKATAFFIIARNIVVRRDNRPILEFQSFKTMIRIKKLCEVS